MFLEEFNFNGFIRRKAFHRDVLQVLFEFLKLELQRTTTYVRLTQRDKKDESRKSR
jgi:hypothetical protein